MSLKTNMQGSAVDSINYITAIKQLIDSFSAPNQQDLLREQIDAQDRLTDKKLEHEITVQDLQNDYSMKQIALKSNLDRLNLKAQQVDALELDFAKTHGAPSSYGIESTTVDFKNIYDQILNAENRDIDSTNTQIMTLLDELETNETAILNAIGFRTGLKTDLKPTVTSMYAPQYQEGLDPNNLSVEDFRLAGINELMNIIVTPDNGQTYTIDENNPAFDQYPELKKWLSGSEGSHFVQNLKNYKNADAPYWQVREAVSHLMTEGANLENAETKYQVALENLQRKNTNMKLESEKLSLDTTIFSKNTDLAEKAVLNIETNIIQPQKFANSQYLMNSIRIVSGTGNKRDNLSWAEAVAKMTATQDPSVTVRWKNNLISQMSGAQQGKTNANTSYIQADANIIIGALQNYAALPADNNRKDDALIPIARVLTDIQNDLNQVFTTRDAIGQYVSGAGGPVEYMGITWGLDGGDVINIGGISYDTSDIEDLSALVQVQEKESLTRLNGMKNIGLGSAEDLDAAGMMIELVEGQNEINFKLAQAYDVGDDTTRSEVFDAIDQLKAEVGTNDLNFEKDILNRASISNLMVNVTAPQNRNFDDLDAERDGFGFKTDENLLDIDYAITSGDEDLVKGMSHRFTDVAEYNEGEVLDNARGVYVIQHPVSGRDEFKVIAYTGNGGWFHPDIEKLDTKIALSPESANQAKQLAGILTGFSGYIRKFQSDYSDKGKGRARRIRIRKKFSHEAPDGIGIEQDESGNWTLFEDDTGFIGSDNNNLRVFWDSSGSPYIEGYWIDTGNRIYLDDYAKLWMEIEMSRHSRRELGEDIFLNDGILNTLKP